jgi:glycosyltransferase involved in cell wall biosynthesis
MFILAAGIIVPSRFLAEKLAKAGCPSEKLHVSHNGVDASRFAPTRRIPDRLVAIGRLVEKKAPHLTIAAFAKISDRFPEARLSIVGDGPLAPRCRALIGEFKLEARVILHGAQSFTFVAELLNSASVFVQHSVTAKDGDTEGFGISIVEAMASCIPVVTTRHNGFVETVEHGVTGLLVDEHDVDGMASAIAALLEDPASAAKMGEAGRERVLSNFTIEKSCDRLRSIMRLAGQ